eukprot:14065652-Heterocapsa_arctica.AAC.1
MNCSNSLRVRRDAPSLASFVRSTPLSATIAASLSILASTLNLWKFGSDFMLTQPSTMDALATSKVSCLKLAVVNFAAH